ncbi:MAG TPA: DUF4097 family beta strand repeat-containing protein [Xanthomonadales bacterium]|nr:DUF4097 family beta strand repeat-containing protein [Xanthomonadales bacterium]
MNTQAETNNHSTILWHPGDRPIRGWSNLWRQGLICLLAFALMVPGLLVADTEVHETRSLSADGSVLIENEFGEITIRGWDRDEVEISGYLSDDVRELEIRESGNGLRIRVDYYERRSINGAELEVMVPRGASVEAESVSGDIVASDLSGAMLELRTVSGDLYADASVERLSLNTVSGDVEFSGSASRVDIETVSGSADLKGVSGELDVTTVSGDVTVDGGVLSVGEFEAVSGDVELDVSLEAGGRIDVSSMSGDIELYLPSSQEAEFYIQTFSGDISSDVGRVSKEKHGPGRRLEHREGNNGAIINLNSFSGDVSIDM